MLLVTNSYKHGSPYISFEVYGGDREADGPGQRRRKYRKGFGWSSGDGR